MKIQDQIDACRYNAEIVIANTKLKNIMESMRDVDDADIRNLLYADGLAQLVELVILNSKLLKIIKKQETEL